MFTADSGSLTPCLLQTSATPTFIAAHFYTSSINPNHHNHHLLIPAWPVPFP